MHKEKGNSKNTTQHWYENRSIIHESIHAHTNEFICGCGCRLSATFFGICPLGEAAGRTTTFTPAAFCVFPAFASAPAVPAVGWDAEGLLVNAKSSAAAAANCRRRRANSEGIANDSGRNSIGKGCISHSLKKRQNQTAQSAFSKIATRPSNQKPTERPRM